VLLAVFLMYGGIGLYLLAGSHALTWTAQFEAEVGLAGCVGRLGDASASGSAAVRFNSCSASDPTNLDASGDTIPDTNYPIPASAIFMATTGSDSNAGSQAAPVKTLNRAIALVPSGGTIVVRAGTYRDWYTKGGSYATVTKPITIQAYPHSEVWFDGTDIEPASKWTSDGAGHWYMSWSTPSFCSNKYYQYAYSNQLGSSANPGSNSGPCTHYDMYGDPNHPAAGDPQMVFKNGAYVPEVTSLAAVGSNSFFYQEDLADKTGKIYIGFNPGSATVELAARPMAAVLGGAGSKVLGLGFTRYATNEYDNTTTGALYISGANSLVENSVFSRMAGKALYVQAQGGRLEHSVLANNGFNGFGSNGHQHTSGIPDGLVIANSVFNGNDTEYYGTNCSASCASAAIKLAHMDGFTVKNNILENTHGNGHGQGFWCDLACSHGVIINNVSRGNASDGLFYEVSDSGIIASNLVYDNGGYGIRVGSANTKVYNNTLVNNTHSGGIWVYDDKRSYGVDGWTDVGPDTVNDVVVNNIVADTEATNTILRTQSSDPVPPNTQASQFFSGFDYNAYYRTSSSQDLMRWIPGNTAETTYKSLSAWTAASGFDRHSTDVAGTADPFFVDMAHDNFQVRSGSSAYHSATSLPADVAAALGVSSAAGLSRGAISWPGE